MRAKLFRFLQVVVVLVVLGVFRLLGIRAWDSQRGPPLAVWHTYAPDELTAKDLEHLDWNGYLKAEAALFDQVRAKVTGKLEPDQRIAANRYFDGSPIYPGKFATDWNRSYVLEPAGAPVGAVVLLHGLTDSPYSLRHIARRYGSSATSRSRSDSRPWHRPWRAHASRLGRLVGGDPPRGEGGAPPRRPVAAAAPDRVLERRGAGDEVRARRPRRRQAHPARSPVLISLMIGITEMARFAGVFGGRRSSRDSRAAGSA